MNSSFLKNINNYTPEEQLINYKIVPKILTIISNNFTFETDYSNKLYPISNLNKSFLNNISISERSNNDEREPSIISSDSFAGSEKKNFSSKKK